MKKFFLAFLSGAAAAAGIILALTVGKKSRSERWGSYPGDDTKVIAEAPDGSEVVVDLPDGVTAQDVTAVSVGVGMINPKVKVLHNAKDRRILDVDIDSADNGMEL